MTIKSDERVRASYDVSLKYDPWLRCEGCNKDRRIEEIARHNSSIGHWLVCPDCACVDFHVLLKARPLESGIVSRI